MAFTPKPRAAERGTAATFRYRIRIGDPPANVANLDSFRQALRHILANQDLLRKSKVATVERSTDGRTYTRVATINLDGLGIG